MQTKVKVYRKKMTQMSHKLRRRYNIKVTPSVTTLSSKNIHSKSNLKAIILKSVTSISAFHVCPTRTSPEVAEHTSELSYTWLNLRNWTDINIK